MIQGAFFSAFNFISNNKAAQVVLTVGFIWVIWMLNNRNQRKIGAKESDMRHREASIEKDIAIRKYSHEAVQASDTVRDNTERVRAARLPEQGSGLPDYYYRD